MQQWYIARGKAKAGPYSAAELRKLTTEGLVQQKDMLSLHGTDKWVPASSLKGLFAAAPLKQSPRNAQTAAPSSGSIRASSPRRSEEMPSLTQIRNPWLTTTRKLAIGLILAVGLTAAWFYRDATTLRKELASTNARLFDRLSDHLYFDAESERQKAQQSDPVNVLCDQLIAARLVRNNLESARNEVSALLERTRNLEQQTKERIQKLEEHWREQVQEARAQTQSLEQRSSAQEQNSRAQEQRSREQIGRLEQRTSEQERLLAGLQQDLARWKKKAEEEAGTAEKLQLRLKALEAVRGPNSSIDRYALQTPPEAERSMESLVQHLIKPALTDQEKFRALFRWTADRVAYDMPGLKDRARVDDSAEGVFKRRLGVCAGYAALLKKLGDLAGLEVMVVVGYGKGIDYTPWKSVADANHAWNAIRLDGRWHLVDVTWAAMHVFDGKDRTKAFSEDWYLNPPEEFLVTHFPNDAKWQILNAPVSKKAGDKLIHSGIDPMLFRFGVKLEQVLEVFDKEAFPKFVDLERKPGIELLIRQAPITRNISQGKKTLFQFEARGAHEMAIFNNGKWTAMARNDKLFQAEVVPSEGVLAIGIKTTADQKGSQSGANYRRVLRYFVE